MKKSLIALAVMAAAGAASAQSSVTLFGIVDATLAWGRGNGTGSSDRFQLTNSGYNSSRLGFRGTEDLGGGMSASFWLEAGLNNDNGTGAASNTNNQVPAGTAPQAGSQGLTFNRRSTVSLGGNWGELRLGRDYTPSFWNLTVFDPFGTNGVGTSQTLNGVVTGFNPFTGTVGPTAFPSSLYVDQVRASNSIGYFLPGNMGGFYGQAQYYSGETPSNTPRAGKGYGARLGYASGPFNVAIGYGRTHMSSVALVPPAASATYNGDIRTWNVGGQWDFGVAKLMGQYSNDRLNLGGGEVNGKSWLLGTLIPVGAGEIRASYSEYRLSSNLFGGDPKTQKFALGYVHNLSKRTALYTTYAYARNRNGAASALNGAVTGINDSSSGLDLGIRHSF